MAEVYFPTDLNTMIVNYLFNSSISDNNNFSSVDKNLENAVAGTFDMTMISSYAEKLNDIYSFLETSGNEDALSGFRNSLISLSQNLDTTNFTDMISSFSTLYENNSSSLTELFETVNSLYENGFSSLTANLVETFNKTVSEYGEDFGSMLLNTVSEINNYESSTIDTFNNLSGFLNDWNTIMELGGESTTNMLEDFINGINEAINSGTLSNYIATYNPLF